jgi:hypothetical protein
MVLNREALGALHNYIIILYPAVILISQRPSVCHIDLEVQRIFPSRTETGMLLGILSLIIKLKLSNQQI